MRCLTFGAPKERSITSSESLRISELLLCALLYRYSTTCIHVVAVIDRLSSD